MLPKPRVSQVPTRGNREFVSPCLCTLSNAELTLAAQRPLVRKLSKSLIDQTLDQESNHEEIDEKADQERETYLLQPEERARLFGDCVSPGRGQSTTICSVRIRLVT